MEGQSVGGVNSDSNQEAQAPPKNPINNKTNIPKAPACDFCNKRKIKCDGALPCFQCKKRNVQCQYERQPLSKEEKMKRRLDNPEYLKQKMEALKIELENQKNISAYWKQKYQEATNGDLVNQLLTRKPRFKEDTMTFCSQTETAITSVFSAVYAIVEPFLPSYPREYSLEYATNLWNKCLDKIPEDFVPSIRSSDAETIVKMSEYCSLFAVGSRALGILDLSEHFQSISQSLLLIAILELNAQENTAICNHLAMSLIHLLIYFIISGRYVAIRTLISATLGFLDNVEQYIHEAPLDLLYSVLCITAMDPLQRVLWAKKLSINANATDPRTIAISGFITCIGAMLLPEFNFTETDLTPIRLKVIEIEPFVSAVEDVDVKSNFELFLSLMKAACSLQDPEMLLLHINNVAVCFQKLQRVESRLWITSVIDYVLYLLSRYQNPERLNFFWTVRNELQRVLGTVSDQTNSTSDNTPNNNNNNNDNNSSNSNESPQAYQSPEGIAPAFSGFNFNEFLTNETGPSLPDDLTTDFTDLI